jgi:hypothetical protein
LRLQDYFAELTDPRRGKVTHPLLTIVATAVCAVLSGADDFVAIAHHGRMKQKWLKKWLDLAHGVPSHDRFNQVLAAIRPEEFEQCLLNWITALQDITDGLIIAGWPGAFRPGRAATRWLIIGVPFDVTRSWCSARMVSHPVPAAPNHR